MKRHISSALAAAALSMMMVGQPAIKPDQPKVEETIRIPKPQRKAWGKQTVPHYYGGKSRKTRVRELIRKFPSFGDATKVHTWLVKVKVVEVGITYASRIDQNKYTADKLRPNRYRGAKS